MAIKPDAIEAAARAMYDAARSTYDVDCTSPTMQTEWRDLARIGLVAALAASVATEIAGAWSQMSVEIAS